MPVPKRGATPSGGGFFAAPTRPCVALRKKEGVKKFDARFGTGTKHTGAMARCVKLHTKAASKKSSKTS